MVIFPIIIPLQLPKTSGHEIAGWVEEIGYSVPKGLVNQGDMVAVLEDGDVVFVFIAKMEMNNVQLCKMAWNHN
jgi:D-arabinose 1-dehydrogenase-like Zn-dependent alcohol dehydrogenase